MPRSIQVTLSLLLATFLGMVAVGLCEAKPVPYVETASCALDGDSIAR